MKTYVLLQERVTIFLAMTDSTKPMTYKTSKLYRIVDSFGIFGGDYIKNDGSSGESIYGMVYRDESFTIEHDSRYLLTITRPGSSPHTSNSQVSATIVTHFRLVYDYSGSSEVVGQPIPGLWQSER